MATMPVEEWIKGFKEINLGYKEEQAVEEAARCINCGICSECMQCAQACQAKAVAHDLGPEKLELEVGAVILAPGFTTFDPKKYGAYHYAHFPNVVTSLEFERISERLRTLCRPPGPALGPQGAPEDRLAPVRGLPGPEPLRQQLTVPRSAACTPSSRRSSPRSIAKTIRWTPPFSSWTCGPTARTSRSITGGPRTNTASASCAPGSTPSIAVPGTDDVAIRYLSEKGELKTEVFDMVVLSVGLEASAGCPEAGRKPWVSTSSPTPALPTPRPLRR